MATQASALRQLRNALDDVGSARIYIDD